MTATELSSLAKAMAAIETEEDEMVVEALLELAAARSLTVPMPWLEKKIEACFDRVTLHRLVELYVRLSAETVGAAFERGQMFMYDLVSRAMTDDRDGDSDLAKALLKVVSLSEGNAAWRLGENAGRLARDVLTKFCKQPEKTQEGRVLLAAAIIGRCRDSASASLLGDSLDMALNLAAKAGQWARCGERMATAIARTLAETAPSVLLRYPTDCEVVGDVLCAWRNRVVGSSLGIGFWMPRESRFVSWVKPPAK